MPKRKRFITSSISKNKNTDSKLKERIRSYLNKNPNQAFGYKQITLIINQTLKVDPKLVFNALEDLVNKSEISRASKPGYYQILFEEYLLEGTLDFTASASAYLQVKDLQEDIYIAPQKTLNALNGDLVRVSVKKKGENKKPKAKVVEVLYRNKSTFVGTLKIPVLKKYGFVVIDDKKIHVDFFIPSDDFQGAKPNDKVIIELISWKQTSSKPTGRVVRVLGPSGAHETQIHTILAEYGLPYDFPEVVKKEVQKIDINIGKKELKNRRDMRSVTTFTIDPNDAKDFDDALSFEEIQTGVYEIGVHIADVSHYVKPNTELDKEAYKRATSVYLVDRVVPMLPEVISNEICSLREAEDKCTFSVVFKINERAALLDVWFGRTLTRSNKRFTYEEAQQIIQEKKGFFSFELLIINKIAKTLRKKRLQMGAISFDKHEIKFKLDQDKNPIGVYVKQAKEANHLIEEFMLLANKKVSAFVSLNKNKKPTDYTFVYRIHEPPDAEKLQALKLLVKPMGYNLDFTDAQTTIKSINQLLLQIRGKPEENLIETVVMRSMSKAKYSTKPIGHYGLGFNYYTHFTSPIRRYPDIIAHRLLQDFLDKKPSRKEDLLQEACKHCTSREILATDAERDSIKYMQVKYMSSFVGEVFDGVISGVTEWGIYIQVLENQSEGLIRLNQIPDDQYKYDEKTYTVYGLKTKKTYTLGDSIRVFLESVDLEKKQIQFKLVL